MAYAPQVSQLSQTSYLALQTPYSYFGLGRINNYVEASESERLSRTQADLKLEQNLFVGTSKHAEIHYTNIEGVIPNSQVVINPPYSDADNDALPTRANHDWHKSLYLHPGDWITWVILVLIAVVVILAGVIYLLHSNEKVSLIGHAFNAEWSLTRPQLARG